MLESGTVPVNSLDERIGGTAFSMSGTGRPVVLVHGLGLNRHMWQWQLNALTPCFRVIRYDLLGHGDSDKPRGPYSMGKMVDQLLRLIDGLGLDRCALVGFSLGGSIVQAFTIAHPGRVSTLAILNAPHRRTDEQRAAIMARVDQAAASGPSATVSDGLKRWFTGEFSNTHPEVLDQVRGWISENDPAVYTEVYRFLAGADIGLEEAISSIRCPTLVLTGSEDHGNSPDMARRMAALIPDARAEILSGLKHMGLVENPQAVNSILIPFLESNSLPE